MINARIAQIDHLISLQLNESCTTRPSRSWKRTWRGLKYLLDQSETGDMLKIKVLNARRKICCGICSARRNSIRARCSRRSTKKSSASSAAHPFGALVGDYEFGKGPEDIELLEKDLAGGRGGARSVPYGGRVRSCFNLDSYHAAGRAARSRQDFRYAPNTPSGSRSAQSEDSRYVALTLPHILMRLPYGKDTKPVEDFDYEEAVDGTDHSKYLWGNAAYGAGRADDAMRSRTTAGARRSAAWKAAGWWKVCRRTTSAPTRATWRMKCPTEVAITDRREKELADLGFVPLVHCKGTDYAAFFSVQIGATSRSCTTRMRPTPMRGFRRSCRTFWRCRGSRII